MIYIVKLFFLSMPLILAGILNMYFVKSSFLDFLKKPLDYKIVLWDNERLFGDNKTWKGFTGMILFTVIFFFIQWLLASTINAVNTLSLIPFREYKFPLLVLLYGALWGLGYVVFELPNSFLKRRLKISPGNKPKGGVGLFFLFLDQFDSALGCSFAMLFFYIPSLPNFIIIIAAGTIIHYLVNIFLFLIKIKRRPG